MRLVWVVMVLPLQVACSLMIFRVDARRGGGVINFFALHDIGPAFFKGGNDADVQDIVQVSQDHLRGSSDHPHMASCTGGPGKPIPRPPIIPSPKKSFLGGAPPLSWVEG